MEKVIIIGAGIAGLGAAYALKNAGGAPVVLEKDSTWGGLCGNFEVQNFRFDRFVHFSFTKNEDVNAIFMQSSPNFYTHLPNPFNIYKRKWIKHPAQNNLFPLERKEKEKIISDFFKL